MNQISYTSILQVIHDRKTALIQQLEDHLVSIKMEHEVEVNDTNTEEYWCGVKKGLEVAIATIQNSRPY